MSEMKVTEKVMNMKDIEAVKQAASVREESNEGQNSHSGDSTLWGVPEHKVRHVFAFVCAALVAAYMGITYTVSLYYVFTSGVWTRVAEDHFSSVVGLPGAALVAFFIVLIFSSVSGPIQLEFFGLKFRGASTPVIFWILTFLSITMGIKTLW